MILFLHSLWNSFWWSCRKIIKFHRSGYAESSQLVEFPPEAQEINDKYQFTDAGLKLFSKNCIRNLATLWYLEQMLDEVDFSKDIQVLEPGSQDFSRLPAFRSYFKKKNIIAQIVGVELDPYVPLSGFFSRWDKAQYYISAEKDQADFIAADFFKYLNPSDLIICFYPFVSAEPALAWGLPAHVASAEKWIQAFQKNLKPNGTVLVIHQGDWEQNVFDEAREKYHLQIIKRQVLDCPFFKMKYPVCATLYSTSK